MSNPLIDDPSIITISRKHETGAGSSNLSHHDSTLAQLNPGNALSKLLDSAIAAAAKETTPEREIENDTAIQSFSKEKKKYRNYSNTSSKNPELVYSIDELLALRDSNIITDFKDKLPDSKFWRLKSKPLHIKKEWNYSGESSSKSQRNERTKKRNSNSNGMGSNAFKEKQNHKTNDFFNVEEEDDEKDPEWDVEAVNEDMGRTVEDFEKWKAKMKLEERRKNGEKIDEEQIKLINNNESAEKAGNEIDSFFSFSKIVQTGSKPVSNQESNSRSSRFSSFFKTESSPVASSVESSAPTNSNFEKEKEKGSRILTYVESGDKTSTTYSSSPDPGSSVLQQNTPTSQSSSKDHIEEKKQPSNDSFFMSLLNKSKSAETSADNTPKQNANVPELYNKRVQESNKISREQFLQSPSPQITRTNNSSASSTPQAELGARIVYGNSQPLHQGPQRHSNDRSTHLDSQQRVGDRNLPHDSTSSTSSTGSSQVKYQEQLQQHEQQQQQQPAIGDMQNSHHQDQSHIHSQVPQVPPQAQNSSQPQSQAQSQPQPSPQTQAQLRALLQTQAQSQVQPQVPINQAEASLQRQQYPPWVQPQMNMGMPHMGQFHPNMPPPFNAPPPPFNAPPPNMGMMNSMSNMNGMNMNAMNNVVPPQFRPNVMHPQMNPNMMHPNFNPYGNMPHPPPNFSGPNPQLNPNGKDFPPTNHPQLVYNQGNVTMGNRTNQLNMDPRMMGPPPGMSMPGPIQNSK